MLFASIATIMCLTLGIKHLNKKLFFLHLVDNLNFHLLLFLLTFLFL